jgi:hypothetical protein
MAAGEAKMDEARRSGPGWRRSRTCGDTACAEVMFKRDGGEVLIRSSLRPAEVLTLTADEWSTFVKAAARGDFD